MSCTHLEELRDYLEEVLRRAKAGEITKEDGEAIDANLSTILGPEIEEELNNHLATYPVKTMRFEDYAALHNLMPRTIAVLSLVRFVTGTGD